MRACSQKNVSGGGSPPNRDDPMLLAHVETSELSSAHVLHALLCNVLDLPVKFARSTVFGGGFEPPPHWP